MCFSKPKMPEVKQVDPKAEADRAAAEAAAAANGDAAGRRARRKMSSLLTNAGLGGQSTALIYGKSTLGS